MPEFTLTQNIQQLEPRRGSYYYLVIDKDLVNQFDQKRKTRLKCKLNENLTFSCGLNHLGDGNFFIILAKAKLKTLGKALGDEITFSIYEDPNPLGVEVPEVLSVLLEQDENIKQKYEQLTDGKKRSLIFSIIKIKNIDLQVDKIVGFFEEQ
ncbi:MAG: DUF1905 domain-containing protein [Bacteroidota bacterium]